LILESQLGLLRLVDFGTARAEIPRELPMGHSGKESVYGTDGYAPPEQYKGKPGPRSDVFALAATAYHLLTDDDPRDHPFKFPKLKNLPRELGLALERALRLEPEQRSSAKELGQALEGALHAPPHARDFYVPRRRANPQCDSPARAVRRALGRGAHLSLQRRLPALVARHQPP
jgi:serine/threonine protein kinase